MSPPRRNRPGGKTGAEGILTGKAEETPFQDSKEASSVSGTAYGRAVVSSSLHRIETAPEGCRHANVFAAAAAVGNYAAGGEIHQEGAVVTLLTTMAVNAGLEPHDAARQVMRGLERGMTTPKTAPSDRMITGRMEAIEAIMGWWETVETHPFDGRAGATTKRILAGFAMLALEAGKLRLNESYRQIAEAAGVTASTVYKHLDRLAPFVRVVHRGNRMTGKATTWQLRYKRTRLREGNSPEGHPSRITGMFPQRNTATDPGHDAWQGWPNGWRMYMHLDLHEPVTAKTLVAELGLHRSTVYRGLDRLEAMGLATRHGDGWRRIDAVSTGLARFRRRRAHWSERTAWKLWRDAQVARDREEAERRRAPKDRPVSRHREEARDRGDPEEKVRSRNCEAPANQRRIYIVEDWRSVG